MSELLNILRVATVGEATAIADVVDIAERGFSLRPSEAQTLLAAYRETLASAAAWKELHDALDDMTDANVRHMRADFYGSTPGLLADAWAEYQQAVTRHAAAMKAVGK